MVAWMPAVGAMIDRRETLLALVSASLPGQSPPRDHTAQGMPPDIPSFTFRAGFPQAPPRDARSKLCDTISVHDNLASGRNDPADKARIQELSDAIEAGKDLTVQAGQYPFRNGGLVQRRVHNWGDTGHPFPCWTVRASVAAWPGSSPQTPATHRRGACRMGDLPDPQLPQLSRTAL
jgi:hypothetical protein